LGKSTGIFEENPCPEPRYQIRFLLEVPLAVNAGQHVEGTLKMEAKIWFLQPALLVELGGYTNYPLVN
jgi:hypothetical protein